MDIMLISAWEEQFIIFLQRFMSGITVTVTGIITEFGDAMVLVGIIGLFYWSLNKELGKKLVLYLSFVNIVNPIVKSAIKRLRPYMANPDVQCLKPVNREGDIYDVVSQDYSFPSGHAGNSIAVYGVIAKYSKKKAIRFLMLLAILLIGTTRFMLGVHYPTDVLAGWALACVCVAAYHFLEKKIGRNKTYLLLDILGLAGFFAAKTNDFFTGYGILLGSTLGIMFEEKYVHFSGTKDIISVILRTVVGAGLYIGMNSVLKLPFSQEFLNSGTIPAFAVRAARYAIIGFLLMGIYPIAFRCFRKKKQ